jgi:hypothetical protein
VTTRINNGDGQTLTPTHTGGAVRERAIVTRGGIHTDSAGHSHWGGITASVVTGLGLTLLLVLLGSAAGLVAGSDENDGEAVKGIAAALGAWTVFAMILATLVGSFIGGRLSRWLTKGTAVYHGLVSWGLAVLLGAVVLAVLSMGILGTATDAASNVAGGAAANGEVTNSAQSAAADAANGQVDKGTAGSGDQTTAIDPVEGQAGQDDAKGAAEEAGQDAASGLGKASWALALGLVATLVASIVGWVLGSRRPLMGFERDDTPAPAAQVG